MWSHNGERCTSFREFSTPPPSWRKPPHSLTTFAMPMSETRRRTEWLTAPGGGHVKGECLFHVIHKVPSGDSPYAKAKHVQLIDKDPSKAVALFWAAINAGDRVDSALKDMAVVMKQLDRSEEAIEAIKSFRYLCPLESQESLDNVLVELFKKSGKLEEEIEMLQQMLKNIDEEIASFGASRTRIARSQGKKVQITVEQEKSRILGNLAWAYLQQHNYGFAEQYYRKAMSLEPDNNKKCNLALCLMHMNRISEAKSFLDDVKATSGGKMDESYVKSYERAVQVLAKLEGSSEADDEKGRSGNGRTESDWRISNCSDISGGGSDLTDHFVNGVYAKRTANSSPNLYTQPRKDSWRRSVEQKERNPRYGFVEFPKPSKRLLSHTIRNLCGELDSSVARTETRSPVSNPILPLPSVQMWGRLILKRNNRWNSPSSEVGNGSVPMTGNEKFVEHFMEQKSSSSLVGKSWADIADEEEQQQKLEQELSVIKEIISNENWDDNINQMLESIDLSSASTFGDNYSYEADTNSSKPKRRLQVFQEITPFADSPCQAD